MDSSPAQLTFGFAAFVAAVVVLYWLLPRRAQPLVLAVGSSAFLAFLDRDSFLLLAALTIAVYYSAGSRWMRGAAWWAGVALLVAVFAAVKLAAAFDDEWGLPRLVIPVGFGFYLLKLVHYWVERRRGTFEEHGWLAFYNYMLLFPTVLVGPIHRFEDFLRSERRRRWDAALFATGLERILFGYGKIVVLANWVGAIVLPQLLAEPELGVVGTPVAVFGDCVTYGWYLYFAFAGYSDIAVGVCLLLGHRIGENFHYPFLQRNIGDFWRCWHMSLSDWCRRYVFTPVLARWRRGTPAVLAAMLAIGLWHEFTLRYVLWGLYHGVGMAVWRAFDRRMAARRPDAARGILGHAVGGVIHGASVGLTFVFVMTGFNITRTDSVEEAGLQFAVLLPALWQPVAGAVAAGAVVVPALRLVSALVAAGRAQAPEAGAAAAPLRGFAWLGLLLWYVAIAALIFLFHDLPDREFRYWRM